MCRRTEMFFESTFPFVSAEPRADYAGGCVADSDGQYARQQGQQTLGIGPRVQPDGQRAADQQVNGRERHRAFVLLVRVHAKPFLEDRAQRWHLGPAQRLQTKPHDKIHQHRKRLFIPSPAPSFPHNCVVSVCYPRLNVRVITPYTRVGALFNFGFLNVTSSQQLHNQSLETKFG